MINMDNPRHARLRRIVSAAFNPRMIKSIEDRIELVADDVIDRVGRPGRLRLRGRGGGPAPARDHLRHDGHRRRRLRHRVQRVERDPLGRRHRVRGRGRGPDGGLHDRGAAAQPADDRPGHVPPGAPDRGRHLRPGQHQRRRRGAHRRRGRVVLHPAGRGGQRDDPQRHQPRAAGHDHLPRPASAVAGRPGGHRGHRRRRDRALGLPGHLDAPHRGRRTPCSATSSSSRATR